MPPDPSQLTPHLLVLELTAGTDGQVPEWVPLLPDGWVNSAKGRFLADAEARRLILANWQRRGLDLVFDYEHQTITGQQAPASGWIKDLADRGTDGLWARVEWTDRAREYLANKEYRYQSPVILVRKSDSRVVYLHSAALTNVPAIDGLEPLVANLNLAQLNLKEGTVVDEWLNRLLYTLNLPADSTWEKVLEVIQNLRQRAQDAETTVSANKALASMLQLPETAGPEQIRGKVLSLMNPAGMVSVAEYNQVKTELETLRSEVTQQKATGLVEKALSDGKIAPAQKEWATAYALSDPTGFASFVELAPKVVPVDQDISGKPPAKKPGSGSDLDDVQLHVNSLLGVTAEDMTKHGGAN
ncbi:MAG: phage protease [Bacillota bacterium]